MLGSEHSSTLSFRVDILVLPACLWIDDEGAVKTCTLGTSTCTGVRVIATKQRAPEAIALDAKSVYWVNGGKRESTGGIGSIVKAPR